jgi:hypothetical protein
MNFRRFVPLAILAGSLGVFNGASLAQQNVIAPQVSTQARVESIAFEALDAAQQASIRARLSIQVGDTLSVEARHRLAQELAAAGKGVGKPLTFSYKPGTKSGTAMLKISGDC